MGLFDSEFGNLILNLVRGGWWYKGTKVQLKGLLGLVGRKLEGMKKFWAVVVIEYDCLVNCRIL